MLKFLTGGMALLMTGCALMPGNRGPDVVLWRSPSAPEEWVERQIANVQPRSGVVTNLVDVAQQFSGSKEESLYLAGHSFLVAAAYNRRTGMLSAEWGYAPNPEYGHNSVRMAVNGQNPNSRTVALCAAKHPVCYEFPADFSTLTMLWGARFEDRGNGVHRVSWKVVEGGSRANEELRMNNEE